MRRGARCFVSAITSAALYIAPAHADELNLICRGSDDTIVMNIDFTKGSVHLGENPNAGWYADKNEYTTTNNLDQIPCKISFLQHVTITKTNISFGEESADSNRCGSSPHIYPAGGIRTGKNYQLDFLTRQMVVQHQEFGTSYNYMCEPLNPLH